VLQLKKFQSTTRDYSERPQVDITNNPHDIQVQVQMTFFINFHDLTPHYGLERTDSRLLINKKPIEANTVMIFSYFHFP